MKDFLTKTADLNRAIVSDDFEKTLEIINQRISLDIFKYQTGTQCFDWVLPKKWVIRDAYIKNETGQKILDWKEHPLHVVIGSLPVNKIIPRGELFKKIYVSEDYPDLIPYKFKYYELDWGFCMTKKAKESIKGESFNVYIDAEYVDDKLLVGEHKIIGESDKCIMLLAHIDHPAQVNDGLAGAAILIKLAEALNETRPAYTLKFQFLPERIGSIAYLYHCKDRQKILGGIFCEMPGTSNYPMVLQYSKRKNTRIDRITKYILKKSGKKFIEAECFKHVVNDDGFYNSPGIDIPCISLSRSKVLEEDFLYHFPMYHTSGDNLEHFDFQQAEEFLTLLEEVMNIIDQDRIVIRKYDGVPHLSRHNLWVDWQINPKFSLHIDYILNGLDNHASVFDICEKEDIDFEEALTFIKKLEGARLVELKTTESI